MPNVVFAVPFAMENTLRFVRAVADLPGVRLGILSQDPAERLPPDVRRRLAGFQQVHDAMLTTQLVDGVRGLQRQLGSCDRLLGILEPLQVPLGEVRQTLRIAGMSASTALNFRDKARMKELLRDHDLPCARHRLCTSSDEALQFGRSQGYPLVAKPPARAGARATARVDDEAELGSLLRSAPPTEQQPLLLEEFVQGREFSYDSVSQRGEHRFASISAYYPTPLHVLANPWIQWCVVLPRDVSGPEYEAIHTAGPRALAALGMHTGMSHMEWFRRPDGSIAISEVAARPPGAQFMTLMSYAHDTDLYRAWAQLLIFDTFTPPARRFAAGAAYLRGQGEGKVVAVRGLEEVQRSIGEVVVEARLPKPGQAAAGSYEGEGYVIVRHPETAVVEAALQRIVSTLQVELG